MILLLAILSSAVITASLTSLSVYLVLSATVLLALSVISVRFDGYSKAVAVLPEQIATPLTDFLAAFETFPRRRLGIVIMTSLLRWGVMICSFVLLSFSVSSRVSFAVGSGVVAAIGLGSLLPMTPGGIGTGDSLAVAVLLLAGHSESYAVVLLLLFRSYGIVWLGSLGLAIYLVRVLRGRRDSPVVR